MQIRFLPVVFAAAVAACPAFNQAVANPIVLDFENAGLVHGTIIDAGHSTNVINGVTITVDNLRVGGPDIGVIFDSRQTGTADPDLEGPPWSSGGGLPSGTVLGNLLIVPENAIDQNGDGIADFPDDEAQRPAGNITFSLPGEFTQFGMDLIDVEGANEEAGWIEFFLNGASVALHTFASLIPSGNFGDHTANRIGLFAVGSPFDEVLVRLGGSGAVDNIIFQAPPPATETPEPGSLAIGVVVAGLGLAVAGWRRSRRRP